MNYKKNTAYPLSGIWNELYERIRLYHGRPVWVKLKLTPDLFAAVRWQDAEGIVRAKERGYLEIEAYCRPDNNIELELLIDENMGDEDGFGVGPDEYLCGTVSANGTFLKPLHIV